MTDTSVRSDNVDIEEIMRQIRARIGEKRGVDYTEEEIRQLANVKLEKFLDPRGVRSGLIEQYRRVNVPPPPAPNYAFEDSTLFESHRWFIRWVRRLLNPILKLLFNPNPLIQALHIQAELNTRNAAREAQRAQLDALTYELVHNVVLETTRVGIEVKNLKMRLESISSRLDFDERRARALEGVVQYRPGAAAPQALPVGGGSGGHENQGTEAEQAERRNRRRRRRGRRRPGEGGAGSGGQGPSGGSAVSSPAGGGAPVPQPMQARGGEGADPPKPHAGEGGSNES